MTSRTRKRYRFGPFELDAHDRLLTAQGDVVPLTPKALDTLLILVELGGHVVTKDELIERVWPDSFVEQNNLAQNISALRKALGEGVDGIRYIDTVPKRGYRFIAPVTAYEVTIDHEVSKVTAQAHAAGGGFGTSHAAGMGHGASAGGHMGHAQPGDHGAAHALHGNSHGAHALHGAHGASFGGAGVQQGGHGLSLHEQALHGGASLAAGATLSPSARLSRATPEFDVPETRYARSGDVNIAYQVLGDGLFDLVFVMGWVSHLEYFWTEPTFARFLRRLASFSRLILFDKRGTGLSDRVTALPTLEQRMDDVRAVMEAVGSRRAALLGVSEGGPMSSLFAATHPEKTLALVMIGTYARRLRAPDYPYGPTMEQHEAFYEEIQRNWGGPVGLEARAPSRLHDPQFREWWSTYIRMGASPGAALALTRMNADIDVRGVLPSIRVPTLILHRTGDRCLGVEEGRYIADRIPGAQFRELPGDDHLPFVGDQDGLLDEIEGFLTGFQRRDADRDRVLATVLCGALDAAPGAEGGAADSAQRERLLTFAKREIERFRGQLMRRPEAGASEFMATFDGPARAIRCGAMIAEVARRLQSPIRLGAHTGECEVFDDTIQGLAVETAATVAGQAAPGELVVSRTVRDLVAGSGLKFRDCGRHVRTNGDGELTLFCVEASHLSSALLSY
jgi:DNA-binding winged helix-turn-helix (wHTH) protein/pimeloyl-ACP methyl ester carboxylesterase/class 3 adenylate cyclase